MFSKNAQISLISAGTFTIKNITPNEEGEAGKIKIKVRMNIHGVFYVKDATMVEKQSPVEVPEAMDTDSVPLDVQLPDVDKMAAAGAGGDVGTGEGSASSVAGPEGEQPIENTDGAGNNANTGSDGNAGNGANAGSDGNNADNPSKETSGGDNGSTDDDSPRTDKKLVSGCTVQSTIG